MHEQSVTPLHIRTFLYVTKKHKWKILSLFLSTVITVAVGSLMATPIYEASAQLLVKQGREDIYVSPTANSPAIVDYAGQQGQKVAAEIEILKSLDLVRELVDSLGVNHLFDYPDRTIGGKIFKKNGKPPVPSIDAVYKMILKNLQVSALSKSNVINITFNWPDPIIATKVVNTLVDLYLNKHLRVHAISKTYSLLERQMLSAQNMLKTSEDELEALRLRHSITSLPQQKTLLLGRLSEAVAQNKQTQSEIRETEAMLAALDSQLAQVTPNVQLQETVNRDSATLAALRTRLVELELQGLREEIDQVKKRIAEEENREQKVVVLGKSTTRQGVESSSLSARAKLSALKARMKAQEAQILGYQEQLTNLDAVEKEMTELERKAAANEANYKTYRSKFEEAKLAQTMDEQSIASTNIIQSAVTTMEPVKPKKKLNVMISAILGLVAGTSLAFFIEFLNPVFRTREDVEHFLSLPVLVILPKEK